MFQAYSRAEVVWHFPSDVSAIIQAFREIPNFCFPDIETVKLEKAIEARAEHFTFTLTDEDGERVYGICMRFLDKGKNGRYDYSRRPRHCLCVITKNPFFVMFRALLLQVHSMALLDQTESLLSSCQWHFLEHVYRHSPPTSSKDHIAVPRSIPHFRFAPFFLSPRATTTGSAQIIAPLLEVLGIERLFLILSAILCENRVIFVATDMETLSSSVHAAAALLLPFKWQHIFIPMLPSKLITYAASPVPFVIGVRRYLLPVLVKEALSDVIIVDADSGECTVMGEVNVCDLLGANAAASGSTTATGMDMMRAGVKNLMFSSKETAVGGGAGGPDPSVMQVILTDLRNVMKRRPSVQTKSGIATRLGQSAADTSKDK